MPPLRRSSFEFTLGNRVFRTLTDITAGTAMCMSGGEVNGQSMVELVESCLIPEDVERFRAALLNKYDPIDQLTVMELVTWVLETFGGIPAGRCFQLLAVAEVNWCRIEYQFLPRGLDPAAQPLDRFLSYVEGWLMDGLDSKDLAKLQADLLDADNNNPLGVASTIPLKEQSYAHEESFMAQIFSLGGGGMIEVEVPTGSESDFDSDPMSGFEFGPS